MYIATLQNRVCVTKIICRLKVKSNFQKKVLKPMNIILWGAIIVIIGGVVTAIGTFLHNKGSSEKSDKILNIHIRKWFSGNLF